MTQVRSYVVGVIMFTLIMVGGISLINGYWQQDSDYVTSTKFTKFNETFNRKEQVDSSVADLRSSIVDLPLPAALTFVINITIAGFQALMSVFTSFEFMQQVFNGLQMFGVPQWASTLLFSVIIVTLLFSIISAILQKEI